MKISWLVCLFMSLHCICMSQIPSSFPCIDNQDIPDAKFGTPKTYNGSSLFGLINGGAELFLEYGFEAAWVNQVELDGTVNKIEIYRMTGAEEAFGIYSVSKYQCSNTPAIALYSCQTRYQLQFCSGPYYISIVNNDGTQKDSLASLKIGSALSHKIQEQPATLESYLPDADYSYLNQNAFLVKGSLGIMNGLPDMAEFFGDINGFSALVVKHPEKTTVSIQFSAPEELLKFAAIHQWDLTKPDSQAGTQISRISPLQLLIVLQ